MGDVVTEVVQHGFFGNVKNAIVGALMGVVMFFGSFGLLFWNEGRINLATVAKTSVAAPSDKVDAANDGKFVSVTGKIASTESLADAELLKAGPWIALDRVVETFCWDEKKETKTEKHVGGSSTETTTYTYTKKWQTSVPKSSDFHEPKDHENPTQILPAKESRVGKATIGAYSVAPVDAGRVDTNARIDLAPAQLAIAVGATPAGTAAATGAAQFAGKATHLESGAEGSFLFLGAGTLAQPQVGDTRVHWAALNRDALVTAFGKLHANALESYAFKEGERSILYVMVGDRETAIATLAFEDAMIRWILRGVGFFLMWIGMTLVLAPLSAIMDVLPFLGDTSRALVGCVTFPIALVLSGVTIVLSMILHNLIATIAVGAVLFLIAVFILRMKKAPVPKTA